MSGSPGRPALGWGRGAILPRRPSPFPLGLAATDGPCEGRGPHPRAGLCPGRAGQRASVCQGRGTGSLGVEIALDLVLREGREGPTLPEPR